MQMEEMPWSQVRKMDQAEELVEPSNWSLGILKELVTLKLKEAMDHPLVEVVVQVVDLSSTSSEVIWPQPSLSRVTTGGDNTLSTEDLMAQSEITLTSSKQVVEVLESLRAVNALVATVDPSVRLVQLVLTSMATHMLFVSHVRTNLKTHTTTNWEHQHLNVDMSAVRV